MEDRQWIDFMKDYYALGLVLILNLTLFYVIYRKMFLMREALKELAKANIENGLEFIDRVTGLRNDLNAKIDELKPHTESKGKSTNNWENARNAFRTLPWGVKVENE